MTCGSGATVDEVVESSWAFTPVAASVDEVLDDELDVLEDDVDELEVELDDVDDVDELEVVGTVLGPEHASLAVANAGPEALDTTITVPAATAAAASDAWTVRARRDIWTRRDMVVKLPAARSG